MLSAATPRSPSMAVLHTVTLQASGKRFEARADESILQAAQRAGLALPYSCRAGVCGSCKATLVEGTCTYPDQPPAALNAAEHARRQVLLCQAHAASDIVIAAREVASVADMPCRTLTVRLREKRVLADDVACLVFDPVDGAPLRRLPGQYLEVHLEDGRRRAFSIANAPGAGDGIELHVRRVAGGGFTTWIVDEMPIGDTLEIEAPLGTFVPREDSERPILMVAGGTGFAPVKALAEHFLRLGSRRPITLYWGVRAAADLYLRALPEAWARDAAAFSFVPVVSDAELADGLRVGLVHESVLEDHPDLSGVDVYMSGPPALIEAGRRGFVQAGLPEERLFYDAFDYAPDIIAAVLQARAGIHGH